MGVERVEDGYFALLDQLRMVAGNPQDLDPGFRVKYNRDWSLCGHILFRNGGYTNVRARVCVCLCE